MIKSILIIFIVFIDAKKAHSGATVENIPPSCKETTKIVQESPNVLANMINSSISGIVCESLSCHSNEEVKVSEFTKLINAGSYRDTTHVGLTNAGLTGFFKVEMQKTSCYAELSQKFYSDSTLRTVDLHSKFIGANSSQESEKSIWDKALKLSKGDANLAVNLIGICGHDDSCANFESERTFYSCSEGSEFANRWTCPDAGAYFYRPNGLPLQENDRKMLESLNGKLPEIYNKPPEEVPHKSYHVYGSAYLTCKLIQSGIQPDKAAEVERVTALMYRATRICRASLMNLENYNRLLLKMGVKPAEPNNQVAWANQFRAQASRMVSFLKKEVASGNDRILEDIGIFTTNEYFTKKIPNDVKEAKIEAYPGIILAGFLSAYPVKLNLSEEQKKSALKEYYGEGSDFLFNVIEKTNKKANSTLMNIAKNVGSGLTTDPLSFKTAQCIGDSLYNYASNSSHGCLEFSQCEISKKKLKTYIADYRQTDLAHRAGANFAKQHCSATNKSSLEQKACVALGRDSDAVQPYKSIDKQNAVK